ncbi:ABC transporter permease [candidate division KSB1 bacterium]|nr:ABC transporter permease [candidate division KSB1 bacterium]
MFKNYLTIALRNLRKHKLFSFINIAGLSLGLACCLLILLYVIDELSYDRHHREPENLYRVATEIISPERNVKIATSPAPLAPALARDFPEIVTVIRVMRPPGVSQHILRYGDQQFFETQGLWVDAAFFDIFAYDFLQGDPTSALREPNHAVLSEPLALKLFAGKNPMGKTIQIEDNYGSFDYTIAGVVAEPNRNSHLQANFFVSLNSKGIGEYAYNLTNWAGNNFLRTYIRTRTGTDPKAVEAKFPALLNQYAANDLAAAGFKKTHFLQPVRDIHLHSNLSGESGNSSITYVYVLSAIAFSILLIACINFMNLSTAKSSKRAREVGVRKAVGSSRSALALQFLGESWVMTVMALLLALVAVELFLPTFNQMAGRTLTLPLTPAMISALLAIAVATGLGAGCYPAFYLSSFAPVMALQGKLSERFSAAALRKILVMAQFVIAIILITGVTVILQQLEYIQNKHLGFAKEHRLVIPFRTREAVKHQEAFKQKLLRDHNVVSASAASAYPGIFVVNDNQFFTEGKTMNDAINCKISYSDEAIVESLGFEIIRGRTFSKERTADREAAILVNEATLHGLGLTPDEAVGSRLYSTWENNTSVFEIIGVMRDFHFQSLHEAVRPFVFLLGGDRDLPYLVVHAKAADFKQFIAGLEQQWRESIPNVPFEFTFLEEQLDQLYRADQRVAAIVGYFTVVAILISCLGLYGLASFAAEQKTKEIGIRKVLGASVSGIVALLSKDFVKLVLIANLIGWPVAYFAINQWLQNFAYRTEIGWWVFALAGGLALAIALLTVSTQAIRAAIANPVEALRYE